MAYNIGLPDWKEARNFMEAFSPEITEMIFEEAFVVKRIKVSAPSPGRSCYTTTEDAIYEYVDGRPQRDWEYFNHWKATEPFLVNHAFNDWGQMAYYGKNRWHVEQSRALAFVEKLTLVTRAPIHHVEFNYSQHLCPGVRALHLLPNLRILDLTLALDAYPRGAKRTQPWPFARGFGIQELLECSAKEVTVETQDFFYKYRDEEARGLSQLKAQLIQAIKQIKATKKTRKARKPKQSKMAVTGFGFAD
ncbi:MAG: hypothetical protein L6R36_007185 [Xanthoria steineri]|nr:MAG: hypothetical protein L6R36_007185 [Xanthoria steineri]